MKMPANKVMFGFYLFIMILLLAFGFIYEAPFGTRKITLLIISALYLISIVILYILKKSLLQYGFTLVITMLLILLEINSKFAIDYFYHSLYILTLMLVVFAYTKKQGLILSVLLCLGSIAKFVELLWIQPNTANVSVFIFFLTVQILVLLVAFLSKGYKEENNKTKLLYEELLETHQKLQHYSEEIKYLTMIDERTKIARDLHDTLGHDITGLIMQMEMSSRLLKDKNEAQGLKILEEAKKSARDSLVKVRQILNTLKNESDIEWTNNSFQELAREFSRKTACIVECTIQGEQPIKPDVGITLYRIIQEALTNAIRHGKATHIKVIIVYEVQAVVFSIEDNGVGCNELTKGNGLKGMVERVQLLNGEVNFENNSGFTIKGRIPYQQEDTNDSSNNRR